MISLTRKIDEEVGGKLLENPTMRSIVVIRKSVWLAKNCVLEYGIKPQHILEAVPAYNQVAVEMKRRQRLNASDTFSSFKTFNKFRNS